MSSLVVLLGILALILAAFGVVKPALTGIAAIFLAIAVILLATGTNPKLW